MALPPVWAAALAQRKNLKAFAEPGSALRLLHTEDPYVRADRFGDVVWVYWYHLTPPGADDLAAVELLQKETPASRWVVRYMQNRGNAPHQQALWQSEEFSSWTASEHGIVYTLKTDQGLSPGLFLDQRENRRWVLDSAENKSTLNLFAYTAGFGLCAKKGRATEVLNVDTSKTTLNWARGNAAENALDMEFTAMDAREFLKMSRRQERFFDLIICDPPSFARSKKGIWKIEKDLPDLVRMLVPILTPSGTVLLSSNFEGWSYKRFRKTIESSLPVGFQFIARRESAIDFSLGPNPELMKSCLIQKK